jgi:glycosyltransferase involved in cell wall biosynthesis
MITRIALVSPYTLPFHCGNSFLAERLRDGLTRRGFEASLFNSGKDSPDGAVSFAPHLLHSINADRPHRWLEKFRGRHVIPWVITLTGTDYNSWCGIKDPPPHVRQSLEEADALIVFHREAYDDLSNCMPVVQDKLHIIPQGVTPLGRVQNPGRFRRHAGIDPDSVIFLMVASLRPVKNLTMAIEAFLAIEKDAPNVSLLLIGPILDEKESAKISRLGNKLRCFTYLGERPPDEVRMYMQSADVFLNTSLNEGMPGAVLEAMAEGLPVLASDVTGNRTLVVHEKNGLLFPVGDEEALIQAADRLIKDQTLRKRLGRAGNARALSQYSVEREVDEYRSLYEHVLRTTRASVGHAHSRSFLT